MARLYRAGAPLIARAAGLQAAAAYVTDCHVYLVKAHVLPCRHSNETRSPWLRRTLSAESLRALTNLFVMQSQQQGGATRLATITPWAWTTTAATGTPQSAIPSPSRIRRAGGAAWAAFDGFQRSLRFMQQHTRGVQVATTASSSTVP